MGEMPEGKLLFSMAVPLAFSMLIQALYNFVDSIFVSRIGENALTAVTLAYPMFMLMISVAVGTGVGVNSLISRRLGAKRIDEANRAAGNGMLLMALASLAFVLFGIFGAKPFVNAYTDVAETAEMGGTYLSIVCTFCFGLFMQVFCERIMQSQGKNVAAMLMQLVGAVINIVLDPILIFGLYGFPEMGIAGAAVATVVGQIVGMLFSFLLILGKSSAIRIRLSACRPHSKTIRDIYAVGIPSIVLQAIGTVMTLAMNAILIGFSETAVAVFGVYFKVQSVALMPLFGMTNAAMSIMAYNFGARNKPRLMRTYRLALVSGVIIMSVMSALFITFSHEILALFNASPDMQLIGGAALTIIPLHLPIAAICITNSTVFQAVGKGAYCMIISFTRQLFVLVPVAWLIARLTRDMTAVWWSFPISEAVSFALSLIFMVNVYRTYIKPLGESEPLSIEPTA